MVRPLIREHESKSVKTRISAPAHPSATGGRVSGLVHFLAFASWFYDTVNMFDNYIFDKFLFSA